MGEKIDILIPSKTGINLSIPSKEGIKLDITNSGRIKIPGDYMPLINKPQIENRELIGNKTFEELGLSPMGLDDIDEIIFRQ